MTAAPDKASPLRIAMWSGPRNISTALMRSWGNRPDTAVIDEPFYAFYLAATGKKHPGASDVIAGGETDWRKVVKGLTGPVPLGRRIFFQKQMAHHLLPAIDRQWLGSVTNCFLVRDPAEVIASYIKKQEEPTMEDLGFIQQAGVFDWVRNATGKSPLVIDARDILRDPKGMLEKLCGALGVPFDPAMLKWPPGMRGTDGVWAKHWYAEVALSTEFQPYRRRELSVPRRLAEVHKRCQEYYEQLYSLRLR